MIVVVDERRLVKDGYTSLFCREGVPSTGFDPGEFGEWVSTAADTDIDAVEAFLIGQSEFSLELPKAIRDRSQAPVIAVSDSPSLEMTLAFFDCGVDDVVRKPVHPREILARAAAIRRRYKTSDNYTDIGAVRVFSDGRDPEISGEVFPLPRRERRILEYLVANRVGAFPRRRSSMRSTASSTRTSRKTLSKAISANCGKSCGSGWVSTRSIPSASSVTASTGNNP